MTWLDSIAGKLDEDFVKAVQEDPCGNGG